MAFFIRIKLVTFSSREEKARQARMKDMALPCSIDDVDDKLDALYFAHWILIYDSYLMKEKHLLAMNHHHLHTLSSTPSSALISTKFSLVHGTTSIDDGIVSKFKGKVHA